MAFNIQDIKSALVGGGARGNLFQVQFTNPVVGDADQVAPFMVRASEIPAASIGNVTVPYFGRFVNYAGDRSYGPWNVTVINDENFAVRNALESWSNAINAFEANVKRIAGNDYKSDASVIQYSKTGDILRVYKFIGIYPTEISAINLDWAQNDVLEEFQCTFTYDYWIIDGGVTGDAGGL